MSKFLKDKEGQPISCGHPGCQRNAVKIVGRVDSNNSLGQTHDCCSRHCPNRRQR